MTENTCGSLAGYARHRRNGEPTCVACRAARREYQRERRANLSEVCSVDKCERSVDSRSLCLLHLNRMYRRGRTDLPSDSEKFWSKVAKSDDGCWEWLGAVGTRGYGKFSPHRGQHWLAHRFAFSDSGGVIPDGMTIDHLCRNKTCVKPDHLEPVTNAENVRRQHEARRSAA